MGSEDRVKSAAAAAATAASWSGIWNTLLLASLVATNFLALYTLSISRDLQTNQQQQQQGPLTPSILKELASIRNELHHLVVQSSSQNSKSDKEEEQIRDHEYNTELMEFTAERVLPLGKNPNYGLDKIVSPIGHQCYAHNDLLDKYMNYSIGHDCPDDWSTGQALMLGGCEPLPRRRCFARSPNLYIEPKPLPESLWNNNPSDESVLWTHYACKSFQCLQNRAKNSKVFYDCADCFDLTGPEKRRWADVRDRHDMMVVDEILKLKQGTIRIGLDLGGGVGSFAARMLEHKVTIVTTTLNLNGPFNEFVAMRGLIPMFITVSQRLPFFDNTMDIVHSMHVLSNWLPLETLEFLLYDIDRVLRPKGLFWLDRFFCKDEQLQEIYIPMIERLGYKKIKWVTGKKLDRNHEEVYLSALLEKPLR